MSNPSTAVATTQPQEEKRRLLMTMANRYGVEPTKILPVLKATAFKGATDEEMTALCIVANEYGLNPFLREIYAFPKKGGGIQAVIGIDGWATTINRQASLDGIEFEGEDRDSKPYSVTCILYIKHRTRPVKVTEYFSECYRNTDPWNQMPRRMLRHKALIQCARIAFGLVGAVDEDEVRDIIDVTPAPGPDPLQLPPQTATRETVPSANQAPATPMRRRTQAERLNTVPATSVAPATQAQTAEPDPNDARAAFTEPPLTPPSEGDPFASRLTEAQAKLADFCTKQGFSIEVLKTWGHESGNLKNSAAIKSFEDVQDADCIRFMRSPDGLNRFLAMTKAEMDKRAKANEPAL